MPCKVRIAHEVKRDILDCDSHVRREIYDFLLALQEFPLPHGSQAMNDTAFFRRLPCDYFISWEILGSTQDLMNLIDEDTTGITVRLLGVGRQPPH